MNSDEIQVINHNKVLLNIDYEIEKAEKDNNPKKVLQLKEYKIYLEQKLDGIINKSKASKAKHEQLIKLREKKQEQKDRQAAAREERNRKRELQRVQRDKIREQKLDASLTQKLKPRYVKLLQVLSDVKPKSILEIGTWKGENAKRMIFEALKHHKCVHYIGCDIFEDGDESFHEEELNVKRPRSFDEVTKILQEFQKEYNFTFELIKGNTRDLDLNYNVDFVFIDGGHSVETIQNDYNKTKHNPVIVLDDYYFPDENGNNPDLTKYGCNSIVDRLSNVKIYGDENITLEKFLPRKASTIKSEKGGIVGIAVIRN